MKIKKMMKKMMMMMTIIRTMTYICEMAEVPQSAKRKEHSHTFSTSREPNSSRPFGRHMNVSTCLIMHVPSSQDKNDVSHPLMFLWLGNEGKRKKLTAVIAPQTVPVDSANHSWKSCPPGFSKLHHSVS